MGKNNILLITLFLLLQTFFYAGFAQTTDPCKPKEPQGKPKEVPPQKEKKPFDSVIISSVIPWDPNEIIGLDGYDAAGSADTFRWVSATQSLAYTVYFENDADLAMAAASKIPLAHCVRGGMVRFSDGRVGKRRAASENVPLPVTSSSPPFFFPFCLQVRNTIPRNVTTLSGISSVWQQTSKKCSLT